MPEFVEIKIDGNCDSSGGGERCIGNTQLGTKHLAAVRDRSAARRRLWDGSLS